MHDDGAKNNSGEVREIESNKEVGYIAGLQT